MPWKLLGYDIYYFFTFIWALPYVVSPMSPADSGDLAELSPTYPNIFCIVVHGVLVILQLLFILSIPILFLLPIWMVVGILGLSWLINSFLASFLNGKTVEYHSDPQYTQNAPEHPNEKWFFINGVAVGYELSLPCLRPLLANAVAASTG
jgi:hypothetical protein